MAALARRRRSRARGPFESAASVSASDQPARWSAGSCGCGSGASWVRPGSRASWGMPASTVHRVLCRHGLNRLAWMDRPTGQVIRRIHTDRPGELVHIDVKKLGRIPPGGGWRAAWPRATPSTTPRHRVGYDYVHSAIDAHSRLAYSEILARREGPDLRRVLGPRRSSSSASTRSPSKRSSPTTPRTTAATDFTAALGGIEHRRIRPAGPRPTARSNGSTAPCSTSGPTSGSTPQTANAPAHLTACSTSTTITAATPPSEATHPSRRDQPRWSNTAQIIGQG